MEALILIAGVIAAVTYVNVVLSIAKRHST